ncbi:family 43 glycosyl hydrolase [Decorospora gaudefroyi]|uniref:Arabinan endo-1,5-alpha-L-arabinosidase n=1 Tax=Decorospora gaudefroyi TaxID=184978 RepID=A0A6A5KMQ3_9PLEO|nr:family 43 glycosyl hydrolase [Decorospora gaudefroyi]
MLSGWKALFGGALAVVTMVSGVNGQNYPGPGPVSGDTFAHDPTVVKTPSGSYLMAYTAPGIALKTSSDRTAWRDVGLVWPNGASWVTPYTGDPRANLWAPDLSYHNGKYYLYYSASSFGSRKSAIFLATSTSGASGSWQHVGKVVETSANSDYNAIDPNLIVDAQGNWHLSFGSFWGGLKLISIDPNTGLRRGNSMTSIARRTEAGGAVEAPVITRHGSYYYLWVSFDKCCQGASSTYRIMVGRSTSVQGPYVDRSGRQMMQGGGTQIMASHGSIHGPGHNAVFTDNDADVLVYHYYKNDGGAALGINLIRYDNGWPVVY